MAVKICKSQCVRVTYNSAQHAANPLPPVHVFPNVRSLQSIRRLIVEINKAARGILGYPKDLPTPRGVVQAPPPKRC